MTVRHVVYLLFLFLCPLFLGKFACFHFIPITNIVQLLLQLFRLWRWCWIVNLLDIFVFIASSLGSWRVRLVNLLFEAKSGVYVFTTTRMLPVLLERAREASRSAFCAHSDPLFFAFFSDSRKWPVRILHWFKWLIIVGPSSSYGIQCLVVIWGHWKKSFLWYWSCIASICGFATVAVLAASEFRVCRIRLFRTCQVDVAVHLMLDHSVRIGT